MKEKSVKAIQQEFLSADKNRWPLLAAHYKQDTRSGVQKLIMQYEKKLESLQREQLRLAQLLQYEKAYTQKGFQAIAGIDEAGRGPLAGPVVAAAVIMPQNQLIEGVNDSKKLSPAKREALFEQILETALAYGIGMVNHKTIDHINILQATKRAMEKAVLKLQITPDLLLLDAIEIDCPLRQVPIIKGDQKSYSIACASILAKVTRDRLMQKLDHIFPKYGFSIHKGYGTKQHVDAIKAHGVSSIHRKSFLKNIEGVSHENR